MASEDVRPELATGHATSSAQFSVSARGVITLMGRFPALSGLDLDVGTGQAVLVRGPNGAGKSTLLRACAGLVPLAAGSLTVLGIDSFRNPDALRTLRRRIGMLGHASHLYDDLSVEENVRFAVRAAGASLESVPGVLARLHLDGRLSRLNLGACSAGQRRRTALASVLARRPALWLLDEPHAALDADGRDLLDEVVTEVVSEGATVLIASHDEDRSARLCDRLITIAGGHVVHDELRPRMQAHVA